MSFDAAFQRVVGVEGDFSDDPADSGGATRFGITEEVARANGYTGPMKSLPFSTAKAIYRSQYWDALRLESVSLVAPEIAEELFDTAVNCGIGVAGRFLQRSLNVLNAGGTKFADLNVDGVVGPVTVARLKSYLDWRKREGETVMLTALNSLQGERYIALAEARPKDERFVYGWLLNRVTMEN